MIRAALVLVAAATTLVVAAEASPGAAPPLPARLADTGLYRPGTTVVHDGVLAFSPQYPLWSDGAAKRRWMALPAGTSIDAAQPDAWDFPRGTRLWKEFGHGRPIETRYIERLADGSWRFASYLWNDAGTDATLVSPEGTVVVRPGAPGGRYVIPSRQDCLACHEGAPVPVLGFGALQLSPDRDPLAVHGELEQAGQANLATLARDGHVRHLPPALLAKPPRIAAPTATARAALGYLHANCGHCHDDAGPLGGLDLMLAQRVADGDRGAQRTIASLVGRDSRFRPHGSADVQRVAVGTAGTGVLALRMKSSSALTRMPPLGVQVVDDEGVALVERWIRHELQRPTETPQ